MQNNAGGGNPPTKKKRRRPIQNEKLYRESRARLLLQMRELKKILKSMRMEARLNVEIDKRILRKEAIEKEKLKKEKELEKKGGGACKKTPLNRSF